MRARRIAALLALALAAAMLAAGCGGGDEGDGGGGAGQTDPPAQATQPPEEESGGAAAADGRQIFVDQCGSCHTLADAGTSGSIGPDLDRVQPDVEEAERQVREGGGGMPAFGGRLSDEQIRAVAEYVARASGG